MEEIKYAAAGSEKEFTAIKKLCRDVFGEERVDLMVDDLFYHSPHRNRHHYFYAVDKGNNQVVGTVSLLETPLSYCGIKLKAAEYGVAGTDQHYRKRGINRQLSEMVLQTARQKGYNLIVLEGIPYIYRKYGFNYAVPMYSEKFNLEKIKFSSEPQIIIRRADKADMKFISSSHQQLLSREGLYKYKEEEIIAAQLSVYQSQVLKKAYYIIEEKNKAVGYFCLDSAGDEYLISDLTDLLAFKYYQSILNHLQKDQPGPQAGRREFLLADLPRSHKFIQFLKIHGSVKTGSYAWQIRILDDYRFLQDIQPVLEKRLNNSIYRDEELEFRYNNFKKLIHFKIEKGRIKLEEESWEPVWDFNLSPQGAVKLFTGYKSRQEICDFLPDCRVDSKYAGIIDILFPPLDSHFYSNY